MKKKQFAKLKKSWKIDSMREDEEIEHAMLRDKNQEHNRERQEILNVIKLEHAVGNEMQALDNIACFLD